MFGSLYLTPDDYAGYGIDDGTTEDAIRQASTIVDQVLGRPEGIVWAPDYRGAPAYMAALSPEMVYVVDAGIPVGVQVVVAISPPIANQDLVGEVLILDRDVQGKTEACVVAAVAADGAHLTLDRVLVAHAAGVELEQGLTVAEERPVAPQRQLARISRTPCARLLSLQGRYGYGRRSEQISGRFQTENLLAMVQPFGGAPPWVPIEVSQASVSNTTGQVFVPVGMLLAAFSDVRIRYVAGYSAAAVPAAVKAATAMCVQSIGSTKDIPSGVQVYKSANAMIKRFTASDLDQDTRNLLAPYKVRKFF